MVMMELLVVGEWSQDLHNVLVVQHLSLQQTLGKLVCVCMCVCVCVCMYMYVCVSVCVCVISQHRC